MSERGEQFSMELPNVLPHENMYLVQIGHKLFRISGASLSSDSPSYFTEYFRRRGEEREVEEARDGKDILFIDRSPEVFELIYSHLQGYCITVRDELQYTMLFADAMYYSLPRLRDMLKHSEYYYTCIGGTSFKIPKDLLSAHGNSPNYFDVAVDSLYTGLEQMYLSRKPIRPPPQSPPYVARSPALFRDIIALLNGAEITMDDRKRNSLLKECRFYHFLNLEQRLLKAEVGYDPFYKSELITMQINDLSPKGIGVKAKSEKMAGCPGQEPEEPPAADSQDAPPAKRQRLCTDWHICSYMRPYLDSTPRDLIFQISAMDCIIYFNKRKKTIHVNIRGDTAIRFVSLFGSQMQQYGVSLDSYRDPALTDGLIIPCCVSVCDLTVNGIKCTNICSLIDECKITEKIPDFTRGDGCVPGLKLVLLKSMWRLGVKEGEIILVCIRGEAVTGVNEFHHNIKYL
ncbi:AGR050Wp [Eremothecium gossypii ATCC 10895]|uniref:AGR050Wp n=1 Tax=Eremothecium gossypii (strain ATCC 10895 / CBS 109.51 / FGSC 9923 / NRRL Y-1056) TaxID=284811 RepID=Q750A7_EREGS|nr:AGR050Wp [Eremothecium gossypii ATCC 10895]AAS54539.2 AGR050Wp [Eremothecium gossypii ATCC 10895]AEY98871.1 FAGR050Wp [Eremothecium gossypii FDAG1]